MKTTNLFLILVFLFANTECKKSDLNQDNSLLVGVWTFTAIQNVKTNQIINYPDSIPKKESITFTDSASVLRFGGVCNEGWGTYSTNENNINISSISTTLILCKYIIWEDDLRNNLESAFMYTIYADQLIIRSSGTFNLIFEKKQ
jgi:heat shock protein HslJ